MSSSETSTTECRNGGAEGDGECPSYGQYWHRIDIGI